MKPPGNADTLLADRIGVNSMNLPFYASEKVADLQKTSGVVALKIHLGPRLLVQSI